MDWFLLKKSRLGAGQEKTHLVNPVGGVGVGKRQTC